ncbi:MAG: TolC family protein [Noviherbaspirillum sp.]
MSVEGMAAGGARRRGVRIAAMALLALCWSGPAMAFPGAPEDPLRARPPLLDSAPVLPGDEAPVPCPPRVDLEKPLSLGDAVDLALCQSPRVEAAWAAIKVRAGALGEARSAYLPSLTASVGRLHTRTQHPDFPASDTSAAGWNAQVGLSWRILDFGGRKANAEAANQLLLAALSSHDAALQQALAAVAGAYFDAVAAQAAASARSEAAQLAQDTLAATQRRQARGAAGQSDALQAATALAKARLAEQRALGEERKAMAALAVATGMPAGTLLALAPEADMPPAQAVAELAGWLAEAERRHPALRAARAQAEAARARVAAVRAEGLPALDWTFDYYRNGFPNQGLQPVRSSTRSVGLRLNIPIFDGFARTYRIHGAQAEVEQSEARERDTEHMILGEVAKAHADAVAAQESLASSEALLTAADAALDSAQRRYAKGAGDILELLAAQAALSDARQERVRSQAQWREARLRLMADTGILGRLAIARQTMSR